MRQITRAILAVAIAIPSPVLAQWGTPNTSYISAPAEDMIALINLQRAGELQELHDRALVLRQADGGTLTRTHREQLQARLRELEAYYQARFRRYDPLIVDSLGRRR